MLEELVGLIDIVPTLIRRFGLAPPGPLDGVDLSPLLDGETWSASRALYAEGVKEGPQRFSVRTDRGKLIETPHPDEQQGEGELYPVPVRARRELYLGDDPAEALNRILDQPSLSEELADLLAAHRSAAAKSQPAIPLQPLDAGTVENLRALGYSE